VHLSDVLVQYQDYIDEPEPITYPKLSVKLYGKGVVLDNYIDGSTLKMKRHQIAKSNQVILSEIWGKKGAIGIVPPEGEGALCTSHFFLFDIQEDKIDRKYLQAIFTANYLAEQLGSEAQGTTGYAAVRPKHLLSAKIPLPPLQEQRRIVARIEELVGRIEEARGLRKGAVEEAEAIYNSASITALTTLSDVKFIPVAEISEVRGGIQKSPNRIAGNNPVRYLTVAHVHRNYISLDDPRFFEVSPAELNLWRLKAGDVLVIEGNGSADQIGRSALFRGEIDPCVHQNHVIRIRPDQKQINPEYLNFYFNSPIGKQEIQSRSRTTSGLRTLSVGRIKEINVMVPSLSLQQQIITYLATVQSQIDTLKRRQNEIATELNALLPSILDKAFKGEL
jgi:type I restriction enzyme S subunit